MDYKKLYEEDFERAKDLHDNHPYGEPGNWWTCEQIFPELKESEDEKIRKAIHIYLDWLDGRNKDYQPKGDYTIRDMIAWLENQGEQLPVGFYYVNSEGKKFYSDTFKYGDVILHVEKQGEKKETLCDKCRKEQPSHSCQDITELGRCAVECEQKPADKVEPKCKAEKASRNDYKKIIEHYGVRQQLKKLSEEVFELQESVIDFQDFTTCENADAQLTHDVIEEIADVFVILRQLVMQFDIAENDIEDMADYKVKRTLERIEKEVKNENEQ